MSKSNISLYIHYPFCKSKCPYCDFNSHVRNQIDHDSFAKAYEKEIEFFAEKIGKKRVKTIFFGGGTPSLMKISLLEKILAKISDFFIIDENCEITLEANPTSFENEKFRDFKKSGINRLSLGIQALNDEDLKFLGRNHSKSESIKTIENVKNIFDNFSFDLIYARPKQKISDWIDELNLALSFDMKHLSLYQLTIEKGTQFFGDFKKNKFQMPDDEISASIYEKTNEIMAQNGFVNYEISNYAKKNFESKHNLNYWLSQDYLGIGAGAHSRVYFKNDKIRKAIMMIHNPEKWLDNNLNSQNAIQKITEISERELIEEIILMGLRLKNGIDNSIFLQHLNKSINEIFDIEKLQNLENLGLINLTKNNLKISDKSRILTNSIIAKIVDLIKI